jgi:hypothetical protein
MAVVHFHFSDLVDVGELVEGLPEGTRDSNMVLLMPRLEEAVDVVLAITPLEAVLHGLSSDREG